MEVYKSCNPCQDQPILKLSSNAELGHGGKIQDLIGRETLFLKRFYPEVEKLESVSHGASAAPPYSRQKE